MCKCADLGRVCLSERCSTCIARKTDVEYAVLEEQERRLKEALAITEALMESRALKMRLEVKQCANGSNRNGRRRD